MSAAIEKQNVTDGLIFNGRKSSVKTAAFDEKWDVWENAQVSFQNSRTFNVEDKKIILIDDKCQSRTTTQYITMKLQQAGAHEMYGLSFVKTLTDKDNV